MNANNTLIIKAKDVNGQVYDAANVSVSDCSVVVTSIPYVGKSVIAGKTVKVRIFPGAASSDDGHRNNIPLVIVDNEEMPTVGDAVSLKFATAQVFGCESDGTYKNLVVSDCRRALAPTHLELSVLNL